MTLSTVLVVDDNPSVREPLAAFLNFHGYQTMEAANGEEALAILRSSAKSDLILLDLMMPIMDGWTFLDIKVREPSLAAIPVIVTSAVSTSHPPRNLAAIVAMLRKPFDVKLLLPLLERHCAGEAGRAPGTGVQFKGRNAAANSPTPAASPCEST